jgi:O-succinylbenzoic acid--CoA ligase
MEANARSWPIHTTYGLTEMAAQVTTTSPDATLGELQSSGRVLPYRQLRVDERGEILVQGATLFQGYLDGDTVQHPFDQDGWFHTGDLGRLDEEGWLHVLGRTDNLFISGGENIQPEEIELALCDVPGVTQAVVVPVQDDEFGQRPVAFVRGVDEGVWLATLAGELEAVLPHFKIPDAFYLWPEVEEEMKIDRTVFREQALLLRKVK